MGLFTLLDQVFAFPWLYQGWLLLFGASYREKRRTEWGAKSETYVIGDVGLMATCMLVEVFLVVAVVCHQFIAAG